MAPPTMSTDIWTFRRPIESTFTLLMSHAPFVQSRGESGRRRMAAHPTSARPTHAMVPDSAYTRTAKDPKIMFPSLHEAMMPAAAATGLFLTALSMRRGKRRDAQMFACIATGNALLFLTFAYPATDSWLDGPTLIFAFAPIVIQPIPSQDCSAVPGGAVRTVDDVQRQTGSAGPGAAVFSTCAFITSLGFAARPAGTRTACPRAP